MKKWFQSNIPDKDKADFFKAITLESIPRIKTLFAILAALQAFQLLSYVLGSQEYLKTSSLYILKAIAVLLCLFSSLILIRLEKRAPFHPKRLEYVIVGLLFLIVIWAVFNTFYAQKITSDISIFMLVIYSAAAVSRVRPLFMATIYAVGYMVFFVGMPYFQSNPVYTTSHRMNALILILTAQVISVMFFKHSADEFQVKTDLSNKNRELEYLARYDGLTGLFNHKEIHEKLESCVQEAVDTCRPISLLLLDIDFFKVVNDRFGHKTGDKILQAVSDHIKQSLREKAFAGRYGGDEFMIIMTGTEAAEGVTYAQDLLEAVRTIKVIDFPLSFSCGVAERRNETAGQLVERADKALYESKDRGRNCVVSSNFGW